MSDIQHYQIIYTESAVADIGEKADYITFHFQEPALAEQWYLRLREEINGNLTTFPFKFPVYDMEPWNIKGIRFFTARNDVILYSVDTDSSTVYVWAVCTQGRDLAAHLQTLGIEM